MRASLAPQPLGPSKCTSTTHDRLKASPKKWADAEFKGYMPAGSALYELRLCPCCGSCLARPIQIIKFRYLRDARPALSKCAA